MLGSWGKSAAKPTSSPAKNGSTRKDHNNIAASNETSQSTAASSSIGAAEQNGSSVLEQDNYKGETPVQEEAGEQNGSSVLEQGSYKGETLVQEEARLLRELEDLNRPKRVKALRIQVEAAYQGVPMDIENTDTCCLVTWKTEVEAHTATKDLLESERERVLDMRSSLDKMMVELENEKRMHDATRALLEKMKKERGDEEKAHGKTAEE